MTKHPLRSGRVNFILAAVVLVAAAVGIGWGIGQLRKPREAAPLLETTRGEPGPKAFKRAELIYQTTCASCHGPDGRGDGESAANLKPPPQDFAARPWRFEPTKDSIRRVILSGISGTAMPASQLAGADLDGLVDYVHGLANRAGVVVSEPPLGEHLLKTAGFVDLRGIVPPPLTVADASGRVTKLADLRGRLVLVHFWGMTCVHCLQEMPDLHKLEAAYAPRGLTVLHVCADADDAKAAQALLDKHVPGTLALTDEKGLGLARFEVQALPTVWLIGPDGKAIGRTSGTVPWRSAAVRQLIEHWLPQPRAAGETPPRSAER